MHCLHFLQTLFLQIEQKRLVLPLVLHCPMSRSPLWHHCGVYAGGVGGGGVYAGGVGGGVCSTFLHMGHLNRPVVRIVISHA